MTSASAYLTLDSKKLGYLFNSAIQVNLCKIGQIISLLNIWILKLWPHNSSGDSHVLILLDIHT